MSLIHRKVKNLNASTITLRIPGFNPRNPVVIAPGVTVDLLTLVSEDELEAMELELNTLVDKGILQSIETVDTAVLHKADADVITTTDLTNHTLDADAHHTRYQDTEALAASVLSGALQSGEAGNSKAATHNAVLTGIGTDLNLSAAAQLAIANDHTHSNQALLDTYTQTEVDLADAVTKKHDGASQDTAIGLKATKSVAIVAGDSVVTAVVDAPVQTASYVQADVEAIRALANDLKAKYNVAVTLINELKTRIDVMNT